MREEILREIARDWINGYYAEYQKHMNLEVFHGKGPLVKHLRRRFSGPDLTSIPNFDRVNVEPDIAGIIVSLKTGQKLWVIAEVKGNGSSVSQSDRRQLKDYAEATNAFRALLISDGPLGKDVIQDIENRMHSYTGMYENGQKGICYIEFFRYLEMREQFVRNRAKGR